MINDKVAKLEERIKELSLISAQAFRRGWDEAIRYIQEELTSANKLEAAAKEFVAAQENLDNKRPDFSCDDLDSAMSKYNNLRDLIKE